MIMVISHWLIIGLQEEPSKMIDYLPCMVQVSLIVLAFSLHQPAANCLFRGQFFCGFQAARPCQKLSRIGYSDAAGVA
jgi:hypothetical protein